MNKELKGIVINPSHGGKDYGITSNDVLEKDLTLKASQYMYNRLNELGIPVILTRNDDSTLSPNEILEIIKDTLGDEEGILVVTNALNSGGEEGADVIYSVRENDPTLANTILEQIGNEGQIIRGAYTRTLPSDRTKDASFLLRNLDNATPILIEYGFLDNPTDRNKLQRELLDYTEAAVRGIALYYGIPYTEPEELILDTYIVKKGDSLYSIAQKFNTTIGALKAINKLNGNILQPGQILQLPNFVTFNTDPTEVIVYQISKGDTLYSIAQNYGVSINDIINYNQLANTLLSVNQQILIPVNQVTETGKEPHINYIIKRGDTLYNIAKRYNITPKELMEYNNLTSNLLNIGNTILIPQEKQYLNYFVRTNDTLENIAERFNTTVEEIMKVNSLNTTDVKIGQLLLIP